ncbi:MAG: hypothetical protein QOG23_1521 [Blastocatellia bacterium]|jgi:hypothetical protein|nr:hypothetical protein [Blastocatellia bacterium]
MFSKGDERGEDQRDCARPAAPLSSEEIRLIQAELSRGGVEAEAINTLAKLKSEYPKQYASAIKETLAGAARSRNPIKNPLGFLVKHLSQKKAQKQSRYGENDSFATAPNRSETNSIAIAEHRAKVSVDDQTEGTRTCAESVPLPELPEDDLHTELCNQFLEQADALAVSLAERRTPIAEIVVQLVLLRERSDAVVREGIEEFELASIARLAIEQSTKPTPVRGISMQGICEALLRPE